MTYYRLSDIKTPPFAYVVNKDQAIRVCARCQMPFETLGQRLRVEICVPNSGTPASISGKPMMADHWMIGDSHFANLLAKNLPDQFHKAPISVEAWMTGDANEPDGFSLMENQTGRDLRDSVYFLFKPRGQLGLDPTILQKFTPIKCTACLREVPEIPFDFQPIPFLEGELPLVASLKGLCFEGFDYLFHKEVLDLVQRVFPEMMLEPLVLEPFAF